MDFQSSYNYTSSCYSKKSVSFSSSCFVDTAASIAAANIIRRIKSGFTPSYVTPSFESKESATAAASCCIKTKNSPSLDPKKSVDEAAKHEFVTVVD